MRRLHITVKGLPAKLRAVGLFLVAMAVSVAAHADGQSVQEQLAAANAALQAGEADKALILLHALVGSNPGLAEAHNLECRVHLTLEQWDAAQNECEQAVRLDGQNSNYHLWLGRVMGEKADRASFMTAYSLAKGVRAEFEEAVRLDPNNLGALGDLGDFYRQAPGVVGGGISKAEGVAAQLDKLDRADAHELRGNIAESRKEYDSAEREFKEGIAISPRPASKWMTLAGFYRRRERWADMESAIKSGISAAERDKRSAVALFQGANVLNKAKRDLSLAATMLEDYLASSAKTEDAPAFVAHLRLARLEDQLGDSAAASRERAAAQALAHDFKLGRDSRD